jgi:hypothetical protein
MFDVDADDMLKNLVVGMKRMQSQRMADLLIDVDATMREGGGPSVVFPTDVPLRLARTRMLMRLHDNRAHPRRPMLTLPKKAWMLQKVMAVKMRM